MKFKNKKELIQFIKDQTNVELENDNANILNNKRNFLYTEIELKNKNLILNIFKKYNITYESHVEDYYFVYVK